MQCACAVTHFARQMEIYNNYCIFIRLTDQKLTESVCAHGVAKNIVLESEDESLVCQLLEKNNITMNPCGIVTLHPKISLQHQTLFSKYCKRVKKRNNYTVAFTNPQRPTHVMYGRVEKFLTCPADSPDSIHVALIETFDVQPYAKLLNLKYPPEIRSLAAVLCHDFISFTGEGQRVVIPVEHIIMKCFDISTIGCSSITTLVNQSEVAK